jgi:hypothetical protein
VDGARTGRGAFGLGIALLHVIAYVITPWVLAKQGTYGALGVAAGLLVGLFLISRLIVWSREPGGHEGRLLGETMP